MTDQITLSAATVALLSDACKAEIASHLGFNLTTPPHLPDVEEDGWEYAELGLQAARAFLLGCGDRTREVLTLMVEAGDSFPFARWRNQLAWESGLRGVWTGLTKRTRTITGNSDIALIQWGKPTEDGDYIGRFAPVTLASFKRALEE